MSICRICPYSKDKCNCKYEIYYGEPRFDKCNSCDWYINRIDNENSSKIKQMFEKEALVYATVSLPDGYTKIDYQKKMDWQKGAEFGYKKADEWHDLRKNPNDLPNDGDLVLANNLLHTESVKFGKDKGFGVSWKTDYFELSGVVFWKEITLPKEIE